MSEDRNRFDWELPLSALIARNKDYAFGVLIDDTTSDQALVKCQRLLREYVAAHDDVSARRQVEYLLTMRRDRFAAVPDADLSSVRFGTAMAAIGLWRELPRYKDGLPGCPSQPTMLETKAFVVRLAADVWRSSEVSLVSRTTVFQSLVSLQAFGPDEDHVLWEAMIVAAKRMSSEHLCQSVISLIEQMARAPQGSMESRPHRVLSGLLAALVHQMVDYGGSTTIPLQNLAVGLRVWQALGGDLRGLEVPSAGPLLEAQARQLRELQTTANFLDMDLWRTFKSLYPPSQASSLRPKSMVAVCGIGELRIDLRLPADPDAGADALLAQAVTFLSTWKGKRAPDVRITGSVEVYEPRTNDALARRDITI